MDILLACPAKDEQSIRYLNDTLIEMDHRVAVFDWRELANKLGVQGMNNKFIETHDELKPALTLIIKGLGIEADTIKLVKEKHDTIMINWIFDVTLAGKFLQDVPGYVDFLREMDLFYSIDNDAVKELNDIGINSKWLSQACHPPHHQEAIFNSVQKRRFGADVMFAGSVGSIHPTRDKLLKRIHDEGFGFKLYGQMLYPKGQEPDWVVEHHTGFEVINDMHALACGASKIVIGCDGWPDRDKSYSLRLYKTLCAGAFYLTSHTKNIEEHFKPGVHLDVYKDEDELIEKIIYYLTHDEEREKIAKAGQEEVLKNHTQELRMKFVIDDAEKLIKSKHLNS